MNKEQVWNNKNYWLIVIVVLVGIVSSVVWFLTREKEDQSLSITDEAYRTYDHYGFSYDENESDIYPMLVEMLPEDHFELSVSTEYLTSFSNIVDRDRWKVKGLLPEALIIRDIGYGKSSDETATLVKYYWVDYLDRAGNRVNITYYEDGLVKKVIGFVEEDKIVLISNDRTKEVTHVELLRENKRLHTDEWQAVVGKEFASTADWPGPGLFFQQVGNTGYCTLMIYGSGLPVIYHYTSPVRIDDDGLLHLELPAKFDSGQLKESGEDNELFETILSVDQGQIHWGDTTLAPREDPWGYDALQEMYESGFFSNEESLVVTSVGSDVGMFEIRVTSPMSQYNPAMSSVPGLPIESSCATDAEAEAYEVQYAVEHGTLVIWTDEGTIKQMGKECTVAYKDHTLYWSPLGDDSDEYLDWDVIDLDIHVAKQSTNEIVLSTTEHKIYQQDGSFALDQQPMPTKYSDALQDGLAVYSVKYVSVIPFGDEGITQKTKSVIKGKPIFTQDDLVYVNWEQQAWYFTDVYLAGLVKNGDFKSDSPEVVGTKKENIMDMDGADLLGNYDEFILVVDGESIYEGYFQPPLYSSFLPIGPIISDIGEEGIQIDLTRIEGTMDPRYDERIKKVLERYGLLK